MHKTLYIDIDEEITSIIDRLRKSEAREVIIVAPKNAMLLQSIVNLRLLKKEADRRKKQLLIITQDKTGKKLIEKAGILAQAKAGEDLYLNENSQDKAYELMYAEEASEIKQELQKEEQEKEVGSSDFFDGPAINTNDNDREGPSVESHAKETKSSLDISPARHEPILEKKSPRTPSKKRKADKSKVSMSDIIISQMPQSEERAKKTDIQEIESEPELVVSEINIFAESQTQKIAKPPRLSQVSIKKAEKFFRGARRTRKDLEIAKVGKGAKKYFVFFGGVFVLCVASAAAYFLLPSATLALQVKSQDKPVSLDMTASTKTDSVSSAEGALPAQNEQISKDTTEEFNSTGTKSGGAKATGQVVIYNEYSAQDQPLVATTRLQTSDGKIFRITKNVVVPGETNVGNEMKPGAIEADVIADQAGESGNIGPSDFKIPGFQNTPAKYEKFYAKSVSPMAGGSAGDATEVTAQDIADAKEKIASDAKKDAIEEIKKNISADRKIFDDAVQVEISNITSSDAAGAEKQKFTMTAKVQASTLSFQEADVKKIMQDSLVQSGVNESDISFDNPIDYTLSDFDIQQQMLKFQAKTDAKTSAGLDIENFRKGILGKNIEDAQVYTKNFPIIQSLDISFWPFFTNHIPMNEKRVKIEVK